MSLLVLCYKIPLYCYLVLYLLLSNINYRTQATYIIKWRILFAPWKYYVIELKLLGAHESEQFLKKNFFCWVLDLRSLVLKRLCWYKWQVKNLIHVYEHTSRRNNNMARHLLRHNTDEKVTFSKMEIFTLTSNDLSIPQQWKCMVSIVCKNWRKLYFYQFYFALKTCIHPNRI